MAGDTRLFLAFFGGREPAPSLDSPGARMDSAIVTAYAIAVNALGGYVQRSEQAFSLSREDAYARGLVNERPRASIAKEVIEIWRTGTVMYPRVSNNTWVSASPTLARAIDFAVTYASSKGAPIGELLLLDHGATGADGGFTGMTFGSDFLSPDTLFSQGHAAALARLRPHLDAASVLTLAGCQVASNELGRRLLRLIAGVLGIRTQGFVEDQYVSALRPGIEGETLSCNAAACGPASVTPFASTIYGSPQAYGNLDPGWE